MEDNLNCILRQVHVHDPQSQYDGQKVDIEVQEGIIQNIGQELPDGEKSIFQKNLQIWPGLCDFKAHFRDPGEEIKESIESGLEAALAGGFTTVGLLPSTQPTVSSKSIVQYIRQKSESSGVELVPMGTITNNCDGQELSEMYDMWQSGAQVFSDDTHTLSPQLLMCALEYVQPFKGLIVQFPNDRQMFPGAAMNEGKVSTRNGLKGMPNLAEHTNVRRDLEILKYTGGRLHFSGISTAESVALIREAKKEKMLVSADVSAVNLLYTEEVLENFDSNFKLFPPLRTEDDRQALIEGVQDGTLDVICSDHRPEDRESKFVAFEEARFGRMGIQTVFQELQTLPVDSSVLHRALIERPRYLMKDKCPVIDKGHEINAMLWNEEQNTLIDHTTQYSRAQNTSIWGQKLKGAVVGVLTPSGITKFEFNDK